MSSSKPLCVVVGVGPGVGLAVARRFGRGGFEVAIGARRPDAVAGYTKQLVESGIEAQGFTADAADAAGLAGALHNLAARHGNPSVLVYNAASGAPSLPSALDPERAVADFRVSVVGALAAAQAVLPAMRKAKSGTVLFTGGGFAFEPMPIMASMGIGKAAIRNLASSLGKEVESDGVHVGTVTICGMVKPGTPFDPDRIAAAFWTLAEQKQGTFESEIVFRG